MPERAFHRKRWENLAKVSLRDFASTPVPVHHEALQHLANQLLALTEPSLLESVWRKGIPFEPGGKIDWKAFADELCRRIE